MKTEIQSEERFCSLVLAIGRARARAQGLSSDEAEECSHDLLARLLSDEVAHRILCLQNGSCTAWVTRCADNFAKNRSRDLRRRALHELTLPQPQADCDLAQRWSSVAPTLPPESRLLMAAFWDQMLIAFSQLQPLQRECIVRRHVYGEAVHDIAERLGKSQRAVRKVLARAENRLQSAFYRRGMSESELWSLLPVGR